MNPFFRIVGAALLLALVLGTGAHAQAALTTAHYPRSVFAYADTWGGGNDLRFLECLDSLCIGQNETIIQSQPNAYSGMSLTMKTAPDGNPFLVYVMYDYATAQYTLHTLKCGNPTCNAGNVDTIITSHVNSERAKIEFNPATQRPAFVYSDASNGMSYFVQCTNTDCSQFTQNSIGQTYTQQISNQWIFSANGKPMIAARTGEILICSDPACATPPTTLSLTTRLYTAHTVQIVNAPDGKPVITYMNESSPNTVEFLISKCLDTRCHKRTTTSIANWTPSLYTEYEHSLIIGRDRKPAASFQNGSTPQLDYLHCTTNDCTTFTIAQIGASNIGTNTGVHNTLFTGVDGKPMIGYYTAPHAYTTHCSDVTCLNTAQNFTNVIGTGIGSQIVGTTA